MGENSGSWTLDNVYVDIYGGNRRMSTRTFCSRLPFQRPRKREIWT